MGPMMEMKWVGLSFDGARLCDTTTPSTRLAMVLNIFKASLSLLPLFYRFH